MAQVAEAACALTLLDMLRLETRGERDAALQRGEATLAQIRTAGWPPAHAAPLCRRLATLHRRAQRPLVADVYALHATKLAAEPVPAAVCLGEALRYFVGVLCECVLFLWACCVNVVALFLWARYVKFSVAVVVLFSVSLDRSLIFRFVGGLFRCRRTRCITGLLACN